MSQDAVYLSESTTTGGETLLEARKPYTHPAIIHELELETRAGSPLGFPDPLDPLGLDPFGLEPGGQ